MREYTYYELAVGSWISNDGTLVSMDYSDVFGNRSRVCVWLVCLAVGSDQRERIRRSSRGLRRVTTSADLTGRVRVPLRVRATNLAKARGKRGRSIY